MSVDLLKEFGEPEENPWKDLSRHVGEEIEDVEEDFGDFEEAEQENAQIRGIGRTTHKSTLSAEERDESHLGGEQWGEFEDGNVLFDVDEEMVQEKFEVLQRPGQSISTTPIAVEEDDEFDPWEPVNTSTHTMAAALSPHQSKSFLLKNVGETSSQYRSAPATNEPPPANVPPPSILLSLSATVLQIPLPKDSAQAEKLNEAVEQRLADVRAVGRVVAGRKVRWKRDNILAQSMKIGQAGKQGGMKLTSVDKMEARREDQEVSEVLREWKQQVGILRSVVLAVHAASHRNKLTVPELAENLPVLLTKASEGALTAPKACFLCGLKRDERVSKIDLNVEDSFGEWWIEHWGHVDCVNFWKEHKALLPQK